MSCRRVDVDKKPRRGHSDGDLTRDFSSVCWGQRVKVTFLGDLKLNHST